MACALSSPRVPDSAELRFLQHRHLYKTINRGSLESKFVAIDCEMVGIGYLALEHMLARVSIVNGLGDVLLDKYVRPQVPVLDYRTQVSGIRPADMENGEPFFHVQHQVQKILHNKVLVGHSLHCDLNVLRLQHPKWLRRDISIYKPFCQLIDRGRKPSLKFLSEKVLQLNIQKGEHDSVEDARASMLLYIQVAHTWEEFLAKRTMSNLNRYAGLGHMR